MDPGLSGIVSSNSSLTYRKKVSEILINGKEEMLSVQLFLHFLFGEDEIESSRSQEKNGICKWFPRKSFPAHNSITVRFVCKQIQSYD